MQAWKIWVRHAQLLTVYFGSSVNVFTFMSSKYTCTLAKLLRMNLPISASEEVLAFSWYFFAMLSYDKKQQDGGHVFHPFGNAHVQVNQWKVFCSIMFGRRISLTCWASDGHTLRVTRWVCSVSLKTPETMIAVRQLYKLNLKEQIRSEIRFRRVKRDQ